MKLNNIFKNVNDFTTADFDQAADRRSLLKNAGTKLAAAAIPFVASSLFANKAKAQSKETIISILNYILKLESITADIYKRAMATADLIPAELVSRFEQIIKQNEGHVATISAIINELGGTPVMIQESKIDYTGDSGNTGADGPFAHSLSSFTHLLVHLQMLSDGGARIYKGQMMETASDNATVTALMKIQSTKTRQAAYIRFLRKAWYNVDIKPWITGTNSDVSNTAAQRAYAGEAIIIQRNITIEGINGYNISAAAATQAFDEPLTMQDGNNLLDRFIAP